MAQSARLLDYVEPYNIGGSNKTRIYTELNTNLKIDDRVYIVGGNFDNYSLGLGAVPANPYAEFAMGYRILALDELENWLVIDRDYDGTSVLSSPNEDAFISRSYFRKGEFNGGSFNDGIFGNDTDPTLCLFNNKQDTWTGPYLTNAFVTHCIWINGIWRDGDWFSKTDDFTGGFRSIKASLKNGVITTDNLLGADRNNFDFGYNIWVDGLWEDGHWRNGTWESGTWTDGEWDYGIFKSGTWIDGLKHDGIHTSINGRTNWLDGTHEKGEMRDCFWNDGLWEDGIWKGADNFLISSVEIPLTPPYDTSGNHLAVFLDNEDHLNIFQPGDEVLLSYAEINNEYTFFSSVIEDVTVSNEIIIRENLVAAEVNNLITADYVIARISNSKFRHGTWEKGEWNSGYRRAGFEIDSSTIDDSNSGQLIVEIIDPAHWLNTTSFPGYDINIGEQVLLTNLVDGSGNMIEDYPLTIDGIVTGTPTTVSLTGVPVSFQNSTVVNESDEKNYLDNTIWLEGNFNSGVWENGYLKSGDFYSKRSNSTNHGYTLWRQGQWSYRRYDPIGGEDSKWYGGTWGSGLFKNGEWLDGVWNDGFWNNDYLFFFTPAQSAYSAYWRNGTWKDGTWRIGQWDDGTWLDGQWLDGTVSGTDSGLTFNFPSTETIGGTQYLKFRFDGIVFFTLSPNIGDTIIVDNVETFPGGTPVTLTDSFSATVSGTPYEIIDIDIDFVNSFTNIIVDSPQNYGIGISLNYEAEVTIIGQSINIHKDGDFLGGTWENGRFENGLFKSATYWNDGIFNDGTFDNSVWNSGTFNGGTFDNSVWNNGTFNDGEFLGDTWNNGIFNGGEMLNTIWNDGEFYGGIISNSIINGGEFYGGTANNVNMNNGTLFDGHYFENSIMDNGILDGAFFLNSTKNGGDVLDGIIEGNSIHNGGNFFGGEWIEGTWNNGTWDTPKIEGNTFDYDSNGIITTLNISNVLDDEYITNGDFSSGFSNWTADPEWSLSGGGAEARILSTTFPGTYTANLTQSSVSGLNGFSFYKVSFDIIANTDPYNGSFAISAPVNLISIEIDGGAAGTYSLNDTNVGFHEIYIEPSGGTLPYDFTIVATILKATGPDQFVTIDNVSVVEVVSDVSSFSPGDEVWTSGLSYKLNAPDPLVPLRQKGNVVGASGGVLTVDFDGDLIIEKTNPSQESIYAATGIWRNGSLIEGTMNGMIFKTGNLSHPNMDASVVENGNANYSQINQITGPGLNFQTTSGWTGSSQWFIGSGTATCTPNAINSNFDTTQNGILTIGKIYRISLTVSGNSNYLEDYLSILTGTNEYYLGAAIPGKTYHVQAVCAGTNNFTIRAVSKQLSKSTSSIKVTNLQIREIEVTEMSNSSTWINGTANGISLVNSEWINGTVEMGTYGNSTWIDGNCNFASFFNCNWKDGIFNDGVWEGSEAFNAIWEDGIWNEGLFLKGEWLCGTFKGGAWEYGMFRDGRLEGFTNFYGDVIQYGSIIEKRRPTRVFRTQDLNLDQDGNKFNIETTDGDTIISLTSKDLLTGGYQYPSGSYVSANWNTGQPLWVSNFRSSADWGSDDQKIILRDVLDYHLNNNGDYSDIYDVDFIDSNSITDDMSGDGMTTSPNSQTSDFIRITKKDNDEFGFLKTGNSNITVSGSLAGRRDVKWLGGTYVGVPSADKISPNPTFRGTSNSGGNARLSFTENLTGDISNGDTIYMYGSGEFTSSIAGLNALNNKDGFYNVVNIAWTGSITRIDTDTPVSGTPVGFAQLLPVELWVNPLNTAPVLEADMNGLNKTGRYVTLELTGDYTSDINTFSEVIFNGISNASVESYVKNNKIYTVKAVELLTGDTVITLDIKTNVAVNIPYSQSITVKVIDKPNGINNFCLGNSGPGTLPPASPGPIGPSI